MNILEELYYGNITEISRKCSNESQNLRNEEYTMYKNLKSKLSVEDGKLLEEYIDMSGERECKDLMDKYIQGFKTGLLIGVESFNINLH